MVAGVPARRLVGGRRDSRPPDPDRQRRLSPPDQTVFHFARRRAACLIGGMLTRFSVPPLHTMTQALAAVAMGRAAPDLVITGARVLSTYTERVHRDREVWVKGGRIAAVQPAGTYKRAKIAGAKTKLYDARGGIIAPGPVPSSAERPRVCRGGAAEWHDDGFL